jgi:hypothetical protein
MRSPRLAFALALALLPPVAAAQERPVIDLALGAEGVSRHLDWHQDVFGRFAPYGLAIAPALVARAELYPFADTTLTGLRDLGVLVGGSVVLGLSSRGADGRDRDTSFWSAEAGLRHRIPYAAGELGLSARWLGQHFAVGAGDPRDPALLPVIAYESVRLGGDWRHRVHPRVALAAGAGWLFVLDAGELTERYFPRAVIQAVDASLGAAIALSPGLELRATLGARRYFHDMRVEPGDPFLLGGALDHVLTGSLLVGWRR